MSTEDEVEITGEATVVYRLFDPADRLLYVGVARDLRKRLETHRNKSWWPQVVRKTAVLYGSRAEALAAETAAIFSEDPVHNVAGNLAAEMDPDAAARRRKAISQRRTAVMRRASAVPESPAQSPWPERLVPLDPGYDPRGPVLVYKGLADALTGNIASGMYTSGRLPPLDDLAREYGAARETMRKAVAELVRRDLVQIVPGKGTYLTAPVKSNRSA